MSSQSSSQFGGVGILAVAAGRSFESAIGRAIVFTGSVAEVDVVAVVEVDVAAAAVDLLRYSNCT